MDPTELTLLNAFFKDNFDDVLIKSPNGMPLRVWQILRMSTVFMSSDSTIFYKVALKLLPP